MNVENFIRQATGAIMTLLTHLSKSTVPILQLGDTIINDLLQVTNLLNSDQVTSAFRQYQDQLTTSIEVMSPLRSPSCSESILVTSPSSSQVLTPVLSPKPNTSPRIAPSPVPSAKTSSF